MLKIQFELVFTELLVPNATIFLNNILSVFDESLRFRGLLFSQILDILGAMHKWRLLNSRDFGPPPSPLSVPDSRNLPSFGQNLANPLPPP